MLYVNIAFLNDLLLFMVLLIKQNVGRFFVKVSNHGDVFVWCISAAASSTSSEGGASVTVGTMPSASVSSSGSTDSVTTEGWHFYIYIHNFISAIYSSNNQHNNILIFVVRQKMFRENYKKIPSNNIFSRIWWLWFVAGTPLGLSLWLPTGSCAMQSRAASHCQRAKQIHQQRHRSEWDLQFGG